MTGMTMMFLVQPFLSSVGSASPQQPQLKSFEAWCRQRKSVPADTRRTIDVLLKKAGTKDCKLADRQLKTLTILSLSMNQISDVKPLAGLTKLTTLMLTGLVVQKTIIMLNAEANQAVNYFVAFDLF